MTDRDEVLAMLLEWRDVETPCERCGGSGRTSYASTATWRGGVGGCAMTADVCDACWGTGDANRRGVDLRRLRDEETARVERRAAELLATRLGVAYEGLRPTLVALADELDRLARGRKPRPWHFHETCESLAAILRAWGAP